MKNKGNVEQETRRKPGAVGSRNMEACCHMKPRPAVARAGLEAGLALTTKATTTGQCMQAVSLAALYLG